MRPEARWFIRSLGYGRSRYSWHITIYAPVQPSDGGSVLWPFHLPLAGVLEARLHFGGKAALVWFGLVWFGLVIFPPRSLLSFLLPARQGWCFASWILCSCACSREEWLNEDSLLLLLFLCYYITSKPHSSQERAC